MKKQTEEKTAAKPVHETKFGACRVAIWKNETGFHSLAHPRARSGLPVALRAKGPVTGQPRSGGAFAFHHGNADSKMMRISSTILVPRLAQVALMRRCRLSVMSMVRRFISSAGAGGDSGSATTDGADAGAAKTSTTGGEEAGGGATTAMAGAGWGAGAEGDSPAPLIHWSSLAGSRTGLVGITTFLLIAGLLEG